MDDGFNVNELGEFFRTLGDPTRLRILYSLRSREMCVNCICDELGMNMSAVSHQLRVLKDRALVRCRKEGKMVIYSVGDGHVHDIIEKANEHLIR